MQIKFGSEPKVENIYYTDEQVKMLAKADSIDIVVRGVVILGYIAFMAWLAKKATE